MNQYYLLIKILRSLHYPHVSFQQFLYIDIINTIFESYCFTVICTKHYVLKMKIFLVFILKELLEN